MSGKFPIVGKLMRRRHERRGSVLLEGGLVFKNLRMKRDEHGSRERATDLYPFPVDRRIERNPSLLLIEAHHARDGDAALRAGKRVNLLRTMPDAKPGHDRRVARHAFQLIALNHAPILAGPSLDSARVG